jgi:hypothetical protein
MIAGAAVLPFKNFLTEKVVSVYCPTVQSKTLSKNVTGYALSRCCGAVCGSLSCLTGEKCRLIRMARLAFIRRGEWGRSMAYRSSMMKKNKTLWRRKHVQSNEV